jgi:anti-sigma regulatory factor (Ser/Thr protein kinase)
VDGLALEGELAASTALLVSEAVSNSVLHASLAPDDLVHVSARRTRGRVRVEVCDEGHGLHTPSSAGPREGGHGLRIIDRLAASWGINSNGHTRVWFELAG